MPRTLAMVAAENAVRAAFITFTTSTLPPLIATAYSQAARDGPEYNTLNTDAENAFYRACVAYVLALNVQGGTQYTPLPTR